MQPKPPTRPTEVNAPLTPQPKPPPSPKEEPNVFDVRVAKKWAMGKTTKEVKIRFGSPDAVTTLFSSDDERWTYKGRFHDSDAGVTISAVHVHFKKEVFDYISY